MKKANIFLLIFIVCHLSCADQPERSDIQIQAWAAREKSIIEARQEKDEAFKTSPTSPMAGVNRLTVNAGERTFVVKKEREIFLSPEMIEGSRFSLIEKGGLWTWDAVEADVTCEAGEKILESGAGLTDAAMFRVADFTISAYPSAGAVTLIIFDPRRPELTHFSHLRYFDPDPSYAVPAKLEKFSPMEQVQMLTSQNLVKTFYRYAKIKFSIEDRPLALSAFKSSLEGPGSDILFVPFKDGTSAKETYGGGRFLDILEPAEDSFVLDFNRCYNPLCNYSPAYNCPLPPAENVLDVPIRAGEKSYPHAPDAPRP